MTERYKGAVREGLEIVVGVGTLYKNTLFTKRTQLKNAQMLRNE